MLQAKYHAEFEKTKGKLTQVADDPETLRIKANSKIIRYIILLNCYLLILVCSLSFKLILLFFSNAAYHGDFLKKAEMEQRRNLTNGNNAVNINEPPSNTIIFKRINYLNYLL